MSAQGPTGSASASGSKPAVATSAGSAGAGSPSAGSPSAGSTARVPAVTGSRPIPGSIPTTGSISTSGSIPTTATNRIITDPSRRADVLFRVRREEDHEVSAWWMIGAFIAVSTAVIVLLSFVPGGS
jgi:hypothetical protein